MGDGPSQFPAQSGRKNALCVFDFPQGRLKEAAHCLQVPVNESVTSMNLCTV